MFWIDGLIIAVLMGAVAAYAVHPSAPQESWGRRLAVLAPLSLIAGFLLAAVGS